MARDNYHVSIGSGKIEATLDPTDFSANPKIKDEIEESLHNRFRGAQLLSHKPYEITFSDKALIYPDGHREISIEVGEMILVGEQCDIVVTDKHGNIVKDSKQERIEMIKALADLAEKHGERDRLAKTILGSYSASVMDPNNELVHLYEIRDALSKQFGGEQRACEALQISHTKWKKLGYIADNLPIKQGRHRGEFIGILRDATEGELQESREIASELVVAYLRFIDA